MLNLISELIYPRNIPLDSRTDVPKPEQFGIFNYEDLRIPTSDGETLAAYLVKPSDGTAKSKYTILAFHGNAGNIGHRLPIARILAEMNKINVLMLEYRGYGYSTGTPDEKGLNIDAQAGLDWIRTHSEKENPEILVYGQSIGGAVAIQLVARNQRAGDIAGLILENTFLSIRKMIPRYNPYCIYPSQADPYSAFPPARFLAPLCHQIWPSEETLPKITEVPILFISGLKDEIVPYVFYLLLPPTTNNLLSSLPISEKKTLLTPSQTSPHDPPLQHLPSAHQSLEGDPARRPQQLGHRPGLFPAHILLHPNACPKGR